MRHCLILLCFLPLSLFAQRSSLYATGGGMPLTAALNLNYEFKLSDNGTHKGFYSKTSLGVLWVDDLLGSFDDGVDQGWRPHQYFSSGFVHLSGKENSLFEVGLGMSYFRRSDFSNVIPTANLGYRYQDDKQLFRVGVGLMEGLYLSYGIRF